uniref:Uncharacterized protein n=1 Tax=Castor canadensis TaxID=51338 RepID=A0A8C0W267_CASCN
MDDDSAPREEGVPIAVHQHALHDRLGQVTGPGTGTAHRPRGTPPLLDSQGQAPALPGWPHGTHGVDRLLQGMGNDRPTSNRGVAAGRSRVHPAETLRGLQDPGASSSISPGERSQ